MTPDDLDKILKYDPLADAEQMCGGSIHEDGFTMAIGMANALEHNAKKEQALLALGDSTLCNDLGRYLAIINDLGFRLCLKLPFECDGRKDALYVFWRRGVLLVFDTYGGNHVNGGNFYYNWKPPDPRTCNWWVTSSGGWHGNGVWAGDHGCREAIRHHIAQLEAHGTLLEKWEYRPFLWLLHWGDTHGKGRGEYDYDGIMRERLAMLPADVREALGPERDGA